MIKVPEHIIDLCKIEIGSYPCVSYVRILDKSILTKMLTKSTTLWYLMDANHDKSLMVEEFLIYDNTGIFIYYSLSENNEYDVFILSRIDKRDIVDFTLYTIKQQNKNYGNNSERITGKD